MADPLASILRYAVLAVWSLIVLWGMPSYRRSLFGGARGEDWRQVAFSTVGIAIIGYQLRGLARGSAFAADEWAIPLLFLLASAGAVVIFLVHLPKTPAGHRRAVAATYLAILVACVVGGSIA